VRVRACVRACFECVRACDGRRFSRHVTAKLVCATKIGARVQSYEEQRAPAAAAAWGWGGDDGMVVRQR
jgi:hypothetical protein